MQPVSVVDVRGVSTAFSRRGSGEPVLLIHGAEADRTMFDAFARLLERRFTVIAYDQRDSGATRNPPVPYGLDELAEDAAGLITALGYECVHVFGTSLGGAIAQVLARRHPQLIGRLVLASTFRIDVSPSSVNPGVFSKLAALRAELPGSAAEIACHYYPPEYVASYPEVADRFCGGSRTEEQRKRRAAILSRPVPGDLGPIEATTLILVGGADRLIPPDHTIALGQMISKSSVVVMPGIGHVATRQAPEMAAAEVMTFLEKA
ncbi:alpha/beta hydrolase [Bradyrhizobium sp. LHD-71]|uniref:alpha/beta fold hydrolase n=1 Tax=Bradyrhizobium sp. LHD-71 TaxID=3072141 RepID=UPI00281057EA|nr:alpha/beta hydrolase [Bradyrhizobium sp. LHD-71]MDQ8728301.1 alpha/beta hydrolase [Bradyrhizobium sp. LHD-71]